MTAGDADRAIGQMDQHLHGVHDRALLNPDAEEKDNVSDILARYVTTTG